MPNTFPEIVGGVSPSLHPSSLAKIREGLADGTDSYGETRFLPTATAAEEALTRVLNARGLWTLRRKPQSVPMHSLWATRL
jgi:hypothetical protein